VQTRMKGSIKIMKCAVMRHTEHPLVDCDANVSFAVADFGSISERKRGGEHVKWSGVGF
jgi:hypothetical protein